MQRRHYIKITTEKWKDRALVNRIIQYARKYAGEHPGVEVIIQKQVMNTRSYETFASYLNVSKEEAPWD